jgi:hypothetical protein
MAAKNAGNQQNGIYNELNQVPFCSFSNLNQKITLMTNNKLDKPPKNSQEPKKEQASVNSKEAQKERLAQALKQNLLRRKGKS